MGKTILLLWPADKKWYAADVLNFDSLKNKYLVRYHSDGSSEWLALPPSKNGKIWKLKYDIKKVTFSLGGRSLSTMKFSVPIRWIKKETHSRRIPSKKKPSVRKHVSKPKKVKKQTKTLSKADLHSSDSDIETLIKQVLCPIENE